MKRPSRLRLLKQPAPLKRSAILKPSALLKPLVDMTFAVFILIATVLVTPSVRAACETLGWSCFDASVALVGRGADGAVNSFCSGVAVSKREVLTAGHCITSLLKPSVAQIQVYREASVSYSLPPEAEGIRATLMLDSAYDRASSFYLNDRGTFELDRDLPENLNYPRLPRSSTELAQTVARLLTPGTQLERIGFGQRPLVVAGVATREFENRRTWVRPIIHSALSEVLMTEDPAPRPGDSGGPLYLFVPGTGLVLVALHSTWDPTTRRVFSPRVF